MLASKVIFNLVYLGRGAITTHHYYFRVLHTDPRFLRKRWRSTNGWTIASASHPDIQFDTKICYLTGDGSGDQQRASFGRVSALSSEDALQIFQTFLDAMKEWAVRCPEVMTPAPVGSDVKSPEVRESLLMLEDDEPADGEAPLFVDEFVPPNTALS